MARTTTPKPPHEAAHSADAPHQQPANHFERKGVHMAPDLVRAQPDTLWQALRALLGWAPVLVVLALVAAALTVSTLRNYELSTHITPHGVTVRTDAASGRVVKDQIIATLPVTIYNGTQATVTAVDIWTQMYACEDVDLPVSQCMKVYAGQQSEAMTVESGREGTATSTVKVHLPANAPGRAVKIIRELQGLVTDEDTRRAARGEMIESRANAEAGKE